MGYNIGGKAVAIGLLALTGGDRVRADAVWMRLRNEDPYDVAEALDLVEGALAATNSQSTGPSPATEHTDGSQQAPEQQDGSAA